MTDDDREGIEPEDDSQAGDPAAAFEALRRTIEKQGGQISDIVEQFIQSKGCLLYTSDAADE